MGIRVNVFCNGQIAANDKYRRGFDGMNWPGAPKRDALGILIKDEDPEAEETKDADISE